MDVVFNLTSKDIPSLKKFIARQFYDRYILLDDKFFNWQYRLNPANFYPDFAMKIIKHRDEVLGYGGTVPVMLKVFDQEVKAGVFANLVVDPKVRVFGIGTLLINKILEDYQFSYVSGYSEMLRAVCLKIPGWAKMGNLTRMIGVINSEKIKLLANTTEAFSHLRVSKLSKRNISPVRHFSNEIDELWLRISSRYPITIVRSSKYLNWRYTTHPILTYQIYEYRENNILEGYAVVRIEQFSYQDLKFRIARIVDFITESKVDEKFLRELLANFTEQQIDAVDFFFSGSLYNHTLKKLGFVDSTQFPYNLIPMLFNPVDRDRHYINWIAYSRGMQTNHSHYHQPGKWYVTKGDGDQDRPNIPR